MNGNEIMKRAVTELVVRDCFWASLVLQMPLREDHSAPSAWTDGKVIAYNPSYIVSLFRENSEYVISLVAHEVAHLMMMHHLRRPPGADHEKWNQACDYAIHGLLNDAGFALHPDWLYYHGFRNMSAEAIYWKLPDPPGVLTVSLLLETREVPNPGVGPGEVRSPDRSPEEEMDKIADDGGGFPEIGKEKNPTGQNRKDKTVPVKPGKIGWPDGSFLREKLVRATLDSRRQGWAPRELEEYLGELPEPTFDWQRYLSAFLGDCLSGGSTWRQPNDRYIGRGLYLPAPGCDIGAPVVIAIDSSGSVTAEDMKLLAAEVRGIAEVHESETIVVWADAEVHGHQRLAPGEETQLVRLGHGGTDYRPAFEWVEEEYIIPSCLLYLTDGCCDSFPVVQPPYPVLWAIGGLAPNRQFPAPWGEVVMLQ